MKVIENIKYIKTEGSIIMTKYKKVLCVLLMGVVSCMYAGCSSDVPNEAVETDMKAFVAYNKWPENFWLDPNYNL